MTLNSSTSQLGFFQRTLFILVSLCLVFVLLILRGGINTSSLLDKLVSYSIQPEEAFNNGNPTVMEFYADWCEACKDMAPSMLKVEEQYRDKVNLVMLNVDNDRWSDLIEKYEVNGIPQINLFDRDANSQGKLIGVQSEQQIIDYFQSLVIDRSLNQSSLKLGKFSDLKSSLKTPNVISADDLVSPRTHG